MNLISFLVANISGTIVQNNQTHLIVNSGTDPVTTAVNIATAVGVAVAIAISILTFRKAINDSKFQRLADIYKLTNTPELREARKNIFNAYNFYRKKYYPDGKNKIGEKLMPQ